MNYTASLTLTVEAEDEAGARQEFKNKIGASDFDSDSIDVEEEEA